MSVPICRLNAEKYVVLLCVKCRSLCQNSHRCKLFYLKSRLAHKHPHSYEDDVPYQYIRNKVAVRSCSHGQLEGLLFTDFLLTLYTLRINYSLSLKKTSSRFLHPIDFYLNITLRYCSLPQFIIDSIVLFVEERSEWSLVPCKAKEVD